MEKEIQRSLFNDEFGCFGDFDKSDPVCKKYCAIRIRCIIDRDQNAQLELLEELTYSSELFMKIQ